jgi:protein phosphatase
MTEALQFDSKSQTGVTHRANEDSIFADAELGLWMVADGMGGYEGGAMASQIAVTTISGEITRGGSLVQAINDAHQAINQVVTEGRGFKQMGTTIVALTLDNTDYEIAWSGDSRAYLWHGKDHRLQRLSKDHSYVEQLLEAGEITPQEALTHPSRHVLTSCLGAANPDAPEIGCLHGSLTRETAVILCSDGMSDVLSDERIAEILHQNSSLHSRVEKLIDAAQQAGSEDDISVIIIAAPKQAPRSGSVIPPWLLAVLATGVGVGLAIGLLLLIRVFMN